MTFAGLVNNQTIAQYHAAADIFVLPSLLEACPTVALEALASGTPVVSTDNPGGVELGEIFGYDVTVVPRENPLALARAIVARAGPEAPRPRVDPAYPRAGIQAGRRRPSVPRDLPSVTTCT